MERVKPDSKLFDAELDGDLAAPIRSNPTNVADGWAPPRRGETRPDGQQPKSERLR